MYIEKSNVYLHPSLQTVNRVKHTPNADYNGGYSILTKLFSAHAPSLLHKNMTSNAILEDTVHNCIIHYTTTWTKLIKVGHIYFAFYRLQFIMQVNRIQMIGIIYQKRLIYLYIYKLASILECGLNVCNERWLLGMSLMEEWSLLLLSFVTLISYLQQQS